MRSSSAPTSGVEIERRGTRSGHQYNLLGHIGNNAWVMVLNPI